ncbi:trigger factor [Sneathia vaginalis]|uniref:trigger factor n=1 Tax=Sneathia vaginalis TaxID=187101 RepID=UPI00370D7CF7
MYNLELLEKSSAKATIELKGEEFKKVRESIVNEFKNAKIDGFRKGHAPLDVIEKTFGDKINEELFNYVLNSEIKKMVEEKKLEVLGQISVENHSLTNDELKVEIAFELKPKFELPKYKELGIKEETEEITDEKVEEYLKSIVEREKKLEKSDKKVAENNDTVNINFEGFVDGEAFEGGKAENYNLKLGSHSFIDTFEDQIVGHSVDEEFDVNVVFPEEYHAENLKGKPALFKVKLNSIQVEKLPTVDDEFAKSKGYDTLADYKNSLKAQLELNSENQAKDKKYQEIADKLVETTEMELPVNIVKSEVENQKNALAQQLSMQGLDLKKYLELSGKTEEEFEKDVEDRAQKVVKYNLIIGKIAEIEGIKVEKEEIEKELEKMATMYKMTLDQLREELQKAKMLENYINQIAGSIFMTKVKEFLVKNN